MPAKSLESLRGIREMKGRHQVEWFHLALETHDFILAENCAAESLFLGPMFLQGLTRRDAVTGRAPTGIVLR